MLKAKMSFPNQAETYVADLKMQYDKESQRVALSNLELRILARKVTKGENERAIAELTTMLKPKDVEHADLDRQKEGINSQATNEEIESLKKQEEIIIAQSYDQSRTVEELASLKLTEDRIEREIRDLYSIGGRQRKERIKLDFKIATIVNEISEIRRKLGNAEEAVSMSDREIESLCREHKEAKQAWEETWGKVHLNNEELGQELRSTILSQESTIAKQNSENKRLRQARDEFKHNKVTLSAPNEIEMALRNAAERDRAKIETLEAEISEQGGEIERLKGKIGPKSRAWFAMKSNWKCERSQHFFKWLKDDPALNIQVVVIPLSKFSAEWSFRLCLKILNKTVLEIMERSPCSVENYDRGPKNPLHPLRVAIWILKISQNWKDASENLSPVDKVDITILKAFGLRYNEFGLLEPGEAGSIVELKFDDERTRKGAKPSLPIDPKYSQQRAAGKLNKSIAKAQPTVMASKGASITTSFSSLGSSLAALPKKRKHREV